MAIRVVGGQLARRQLQVPPGDGVRPTSDRVRESLFSSLGERWDGVTILDLFAGSGALGIECLSRGAAQAVFVERDGRTQAVLRRNLTGLALEERSRVLRMEAARALRLLLREGARFGAVLLDPPYAGVLLQESLERLSDGALLAEDAVVVCEHPSRTPPDDEIGVLRLQDRRKYGDTTVTVYGAALSQMD